MWRIGSFLVSLGFAGFAAFSSSNTMQLNSYSIGPGATNSSSSNTYKLQGSAGEQTNGSTSGNTYSANNGSIQTEQLNVPPAPTLSNGSGTYYNKLNFVINTGGNPTDTTYSVAVSTNNFTTTYYVQGDGTLGASPLYQTYGQWNSSTGTLMIGLTQNTAYEVKVDAMQGMFSNTNYGAYASASTVTSSLTFSLSPNSISMGNLLPGSVATSSNLSFGITTNAASGGAIYIYGQNNGLLSATESHTIPAYSGNLTSQSEGFGAQGTNPTQTSGGPLTTASPFNGTGNSVGAEATGPQEMFYCVAAIIGGSSNANLQAITSHLTPASSDYQEILTFVASANF